MLIRLCGHFIDNPSHIDKMICIKGLPDDFFFRQNAQYQGKELIRPWEPDVEANIPQHIRHLCDPFEIIKVFPPIAPGAVHIVDRRTVIGLRFDYVSEAGQTMWDRIERYLERSVPRDQLVPKPVIVAPNHKSDFNPHEARRTTRGGLEMRPTEIPVVDLKPMVISPAVLPIPPAPIAISVPAQTEAPKPTSFHCDQCIKKFEKQQALRMHKMKMHKKEPVGV